MPSILQCLFKHDEDILKIQRVKDYLAGKLHTRLLDMVESYLLLAPNTITQRETFLEILNKNKIDPSKEDVNAIITIDRIRITPLILATQRRLDKTMIDLLDNGANVNQESSMLSPILQATQTQNKGLTKLLITYGASAPSYDRRKPGNIIFYKECQAELKANESVSLST